MSQTSPLSHQLPISNPLPPFPTPPLLLCQPPWCLSRYYRAHCCRHLQIISLWHLLFPPSPSSLSATKMLVALHLRSLLSSFANYFIVSLVIPSLSFSVSHQDVCRATLAPAVVVICKSFSTSSPSSSGFSSSFQSAKLSRSTRSWDAYSSPMSPTCFRVHLDWWNLRM